MCKPVNRWYWKCRDCLDHCSVEQQVSKLDCGACGGSMWPMGRVEPTTGKLFQTEWRCACDGRCTNAPGPNCECRCGGENHGKGTVVEVQVEAGKAPRARNLSTETLRRIASEWRETMAAIRQVIECIQREYGFNWKPPEVFERYNRLLSTVRKANEKNTHKSRMELLAKEGFKPAGITAVTPRAAAVADTGLFAGAARNGQS